MSVHFSFELTISSASTSPFNTASPRSSWFGPRDQTSPSRCFLSYNISHVDHRDPYSSPVVIIAIGPSKVPFPIHKGKLEQLTTFFDIHGGPANTPSPLDAGSPSAVGSDGVVVLRSEDADTEVKAEWDGGESNNAGEIKKPPDFAIVDRFHTVGAFRIVSNLHCGLWL